ncbi:MAG: 3'-5' exonuclease [Saprospiraceae bacterium]|nr:3'-5' exonuclease [Saprospiraceae bacterium]
MAWRDLFKSAGPPAPEWAAYLEHFKSPLPRTSSLEDINFVVLDLETTGLNTRKDHMLSLGAVQVKNFEIQIERRMEYFVLQRDYSPNQSIGIHGIMPEQTATGIGEVELMQKLLSFLGSAVIVGHHIGFDVAILNKAIKRIYGKNLKNKVIDTVDLVKRWDRLGSTAPHRDLSLDAVCQRWKLPLHERHTAAGDTLLTAMLFLKLLGNLQKRGVNTLGALLRN